MASKIYNIQYARAFAAISIVIYHVMRKGMLLGYNQSEFSVGKMSVPLFFLISGFIMVFIQNSNPKSPYIFLRNRVTRILPVYYIFTTLILIIYLLKPSLVHYSHYPDISIISSYTLWPILNTSMLLNPGWTLRPEFTFYIIFFLVCILFRRSENKYFYIAIVCIILSIVSHFSSSIVFRSFFNYMYIFGLGVIVFLLRERIHSVHNLLWFFASSILSIISISLFSDVNFFTCIVLAINFLFLLKCDEFFNHNSKLSNFISYLGDASYSIYLTHVLTIGFFTFLFTHLNLSNGFLYLFSNTLISIIVGVFSYEFVEKPCIKFFRKIWK